MLKKLQAQKSNYNVFNWEQERRETERLAKSIQYHKSQQRAAKTSKANRRSIQTSQGGADTNREMYDLYQKSVREAAQSTRGPGDLESNQVAASNGSLEIEQPTAILPDIKGAKSVTHDQFLKLRDGYIT